MTIPADTVEGKGFYAKWTESGSGGGGDEPGDGTVLVSFVDASGSPMQQNCTPVTAETMTLTDGGWYVVNDDVEIGNGELGVSIAVEGSANLVLMDGKSLTVNGKSFEAAVGVPSGASLTIYGQTAGTGALYANGNTAGAGIGGGQNGACGSVTINGGHIEAVGGDYGAGIGGGYAGAGGNVTVNGGNVRTVGGNISTPGIGRGGVVGSAVPPSSGTLIVGTDVVVKAGSISILGDDDVQTADPSTHQIAIDDEWRYFLIEKIPSSPEPGVFSNIEYREKDGTLIENLTPTTYEEGVGVSLATAVPPTRPGYDFGGWYDNYNLEGTAVTVVPTTATGDLCFFAKWIGKTYNIRYFVEGVEDTSLTPKTYTVDTPVNLPYSPRKDFYIFDFWCDNPELTGDSISVLRDTTEDVVLYARFKPQNFSITYYDGSQTLSLEPSSYNIESETIVLPTPVKTDYVFDGWYTNSEFEGSTVTTIPAGSTGVRRFYSKWHAAPPATASDVPYMAGGSTGTHDCKILSTRVTELVDDWYVLTDDIDYGTTGLTVSGDVTLILADDATLTVEGDYSKAGIYVPVGSSLTIYAQSAGTGAILATGGSGAAGIGGNRGPMEDEEPDEGTCGTVVINGGIITATGGGWAAGIGGGSSGNGGTVTINGGVVTATGVSGGAGIGGGAFKDGGSVTVNGGTVTAVGGAYSETTIAAGIGGGIWGSQGTLSIAADITVKSGDAADDLAVIASAEGSVTLDGKQFYSIVALEQFNIVYMDGASPLNLAPAKYTAGQVCELPVPMAASGYHFAGWYTTAAFTSEPVSEIPASATGTQTFYVRWGEGSEGGVPQFTIENGVLKAVDLNGNEDITIPDTVTEIYQYVFRNCTGLESVTLTDNVKRIGNGAFQNCSNLTSIDFGNGLETIGESVFNGCTSLTNGEDGLYIPDSVTSIGANAFFPQCGVTKVSLPGSMYNSNSFVHPGFEYWDQEVVYRTSDPVFYVQNGGYLLSVDPKANTVLSVPGIVTEIGAGAFKGCVSVASVSIPNTVTNIEVAAFANCSGLTSVDIAEGVTTIKNGAFQACTSLASVTIPDSVTELGESAFWECTNLESATIGSGVTVIPDTLFWGCESMQSVTFRGNLTDIGFGAFFECTGLLSVTFPTSLKTIDFWAFKGCTSLTSVKVPEGATAGEFSFADCTGLRSLNIGGEEKIQNRRLMSARFGRGLLAAGEEETVSTKIGRCAFYGCSSLEEATIGKTVDEIGGGAFGGCDSLSTVNVEEGNDNYKSENGMLLTKDGATLISAFGEETSVTVPEGVVTVSGSAFAGYATLQSVVLPSGVTTIGEAAFSNATVFATITIPSTVTSIGANAFMDTVLATVNVEKDDTARVKTLVEATGYTGTVAYNDSGSEPATEWPADTSTVEGQTAAEAYGVTGDLATADAKKLADWAKENSVEFGGTIITDAYLLNCANTAAAVEAATETAEEAIKITAISFNELGEPVLTCPDSYGNGTVVIEGAASLAAPIQWHDKTSGDKFFFFRTVLKP